jgi:hypothetical protein
MTTITPARITARNRVNAEANRLADQIQLLLMPWVGRKVYKTTGGGGWVASLKTTMYGLQRPAGFRLSYEVGVYALWAHLDLFSLNTGYVKRSFWIGDIGGGGVLTTLRSEPLNARTDYSLDKAQATERRIQDLELELASLRGDLAELRT